ncbi:Pyrrolo-quinoline quinone beta-propeller repeat protein [Haloterrigena turkmenica DSM 5511]|uniref:Pyrrolo-quinoline quinone beta-propeller repeat protein n=1 Tax=Haloterrigena turkmenica (strain ATCC 51198 / DSM 5511 / JCM 9101 / NCIMB 13204 / VKM B-1734 / 4k) TaxID=543526 RepID=D2RPV6_HALTV|nr:PQQ-binding-like beta-propeller repeat protein [Haloterrigena turkmenica]ADB60215.1 Pyrrolo-quinoline quinone beta-propeller repeat protein [Haloterrigena turkmenica DSM 5511]
MESPLTRRETLGAIAGAGAVGAAGCLDVLSDDQTRLEGWPSYRYDAANSGRNPDAAGPNGDLETAWKQDLEPPGDGYPSELSCPFVLGERVIVAFDFDGGVSRETHVIAVDRETGEQDWSETFELAPDGSNAATAMPSRTLESDGVAVYLVTLDGGPTLRALDPESGDERWQASIERQLYSPLTADGGSLYAGERTYAVFDADDGDLERRYEWERDGSVQRLTNEFPPTVTEDVVYASVADTLRATDRDDGSLLWSAESPFDSKVDDGGVPLTQPVVGDDAVYAIAGDSVRADAGGGIVALSTNDGDQLWSFQPDPTESDADGNGPSASRSGVAGLPLVFEESETICAIGFEGGERTFFGLEAEDGSVRWDLDGIVAIDPADGSTVGSGTLDLGERANVAHTPAIADDRLYVNTSEGAVAIGP